MATTSIPRAVTDAGDGARQRRPARAQVARDERRGVRDSDRARDSEVFSDIVLDVIVASAGDMLQGLVSGTLRRFDTWRLSGLIPGTP